MDLHQHDLAAGTTTSCGDLAVVLKPAGDALALAVTRGGRPLFARVVLGITVDGERLGPGSAVDGVTRRRVRETYRAYTGKAVGTRDVDHQETAYALRAPGGRRWGLVVRVAADGFAFRYVLPDPGVLGPERTRYVPKGGGRGWLLDYQTWYETPRFGSDLDRLAPGDYGFPLLLAVGGAGPAGEESYVLLSESDIDGRSSGAHPRFDGTAFTVVTADETLAVEAGHATPWRVGIVGGLAGIVASHLVDDLAPAAPPDHVEPRPGRAAWSWWSSQYSGAYLDDQKRFTDFAATQGWEHVLVDCGWDPTWVPELVSYASARGVQVHLWSSWKDLDGPEALAKLALWRSWGVAGIKVDFMESESRERYRWYDAILAETARTGLMVNFHGSVIPRGWARTHPQVVSYEGIRGAEYYVFYQEPLSAAHNVIQPFTRNVVGAMDYTPVAFSAPRRETSEAHELALGVVFESGITHFADDPAGYTARPPAATLLAEIAPAWDEVRLLDGHPDRRAVVARRAGDRWFVGAISATGPDRVALPLAGLVSGAADVWLVTDAPGGGLGAALREGVTAAEIPVDLVANGGYAAIVVPAGAPLFRARANPTYTLPRVSPAVAVLGADGTAALDADPRAVLRVPPGWTAVPGKAPGLWTVRAPADARPGALAVVTAQVPGAEGVPAVAHARIAVPLAPGEHALSALPFLRCRNEVGPVERDLANGGGDPRDGAPLTVRGVVYGDGLGVSQRSTVEFVLAGGPRLLTGSVAVDDETPGGTATATVLVDGVERAVFALAGGEPPVPFEVAVDGAATLALRTDPGPDGGEAHVDWLRPRLAV